MRNYEVVIIVHPDIEESALTAIVDKIKSWITDGGGNIAKVDMWGRRRMAYPIQKQSEGQYVLIQSEMAPTFCVELERNLKFQEPVLRYMVTLMND